MKAVWDEETEKGSDTVKRQTRSGVSQKAWGVLLETQWKKMAESTVKTGRNKFCRVKTALKND